MEELTFLLLVLGIVLTVVTLVGHGIWVLLAAVFGQRSRPTHPRSQQQLGGNFCPRCFAPLESGQRACALCGWPQERVERPDGRAPLHAMRRQLEEFAWRGAIDAETRTRLVAAIDEQERRLIEEHQHAPRETASDIAATETAAAEPAAGPAPPEPAAPWAAASEMPSPPAAAPQPAPLAERARKYATSRAAAAEAIREDDAASEVAELPRRREAAARLFAAFMEEKNIRWGELVGGLLIVGCSIALVISFWAEIATRPLLKFGLFNGVTAALFGVGMYTDRRWKIHTTSHGVLVIATLLVPLNFLAIAAFTQASPRVDLVSLAGEGLSLLIFATLVYLAGRIVVPNDAALLAAGVIIPCLMQLLVRRFAEPATPLAGLYALAAVPVMNYLTASALVVRRHWQSSRHTPCAAAEPEPESADGTPTVAATLDETEADRVLVFLGLVSAATLMPLALMLHNVPPAQTTLHWLSPLAALCGLPAILVGLLFWRRMTDRRFTALQTAGIAVGAFGGLIMAGAIVIAWPDPATLLPTALATAAMLLVVAIGFAIPAAHVPAGLALAAAWLVAFYLVRGNVGWTLADAATIRGSLLSAASGHALVPLVALFAIVAWRLRAARRGEAALMYGLVTAAVAAASLGFVLWFGFARLGDPAHATWTLAIYATAALAAAWLLDRADATLVGSALLLAALVQAVVFRYGSEWRLEQPLIVALLSHATLAAVGAGLLLLPRKPAPEQMRKALVWSAQMTSAAAAVWIAATAPVSSAAALAASLTWLAGAWMLLSVLGNWPPLFTASQVALVLAIFCGVTATVETRAWYVAAPRPWLDPWFLEAQAIALAGYCLIVAAFREVLTQSEKRQSQYVIEPPTPAWRAASERLLNPTWPAVDHLAQGAIVLVLVLIATYAAVPGVAQELSLTEAANRRAEVLTASDRFELPGIPRAHAAGEGAWMLLAAVVLTLASGLRQGDKRWRLAGLVLSATVLCALWSVRWEWQVAVASALRWLTAGAFAIIALALWIRRTGRGTVSPQTIREVRDLSVTLVLVVYVAMGAYVCSAALMRAELPANIQQLWPWAFLWALVAGVVAVAAPHAADARRRNDGDPSAGEVYGWLRHLREVLLLLAVAPLVVMLAFTVARALDAHPIVGPDAGTWFRRIGWDISYGVPLAVIALVLVGYAIRDRSAGFAFAASLLSGVVATIVVLLRLARGGGALDAVAWITIAQVNAIVTAVAALLWLAATSWYRTYSHSPAETGHNRASPSAAAAAWPALLVTQTALAAALCGTFLIPAVIHLGWTAAPSNWALAADGALGWCAVALAVASAVWLHRRQSVPQGAVALFAGALAALVALTAGHWDTGNWLAFDTQMVGFCAAAWLVPLAARRVNYLTMSGKFGWHALKGPGIDGGSPGHALHIASGRATQRRFQSQDSHSELATDPSRNADAAPMSWSAPAVRLLALAAVLLALRGLEGRGFTPWWSYAVLVAVSVRNLWIAWHERRRGFVWIAALLFAVAVHAWWIDEGHKLTSTRGFGEMFEWLWLVALAAAVVAWMSAWIERQRMAPQATADGSPRGAAFHRFAAWAIVVVLLLTTSAGLLADLASDTIAVSLPLAWATWAAALVTAAVCLWDPAIRWPVACMYCVGLLAVGLYLDGLNLRPPMFHWALGNALAAYALATSALWSGRHRLQNMALRLRVPAAAWESLTQPDDAEIRSSATWEGAGHGWLVPMNLLLGVLVLLLVAWVELVMEGFAQRIVAAYSVGAQAFAIGLLARGAVRTPLQYLALVWGVLFAVAFGWAWLPPDFAEPWLHRLIIAVVALAAAVVVYGFGLVKLLRRENEWTRAAARLVPALAGLAAALILVVLVMEAATFAQEGSVPIAWPARLAVALALALLTFASLAAALLPGRDPLGLSERGRTAYVYAAEALVALLCLHIRVTMPWLFRGWFQQFWPLVVMGIAFAGVGFGELFQRRRQHVLSEPLHTTGALLPLLPAVGFWFLSSRIDYSLVLLSIGVLYAALSVLRRSFLYGVLAAVAANGSLWYLLSRREDLSLLEHPQLWLIPPALCALAAGYINRERLTQRQSAALRYAAAMVIYVSSTADVFIQGVADAPWLPGVLAGLSILGVLAGILLRVRAFLYLGTAFLVVALMTVIWHAAEEQTWIWWVAGIVTGSLILLVLGFFEKRRDDVLRVVEELKHWQA